jgi:hypothetical protein
MTAPEKENSTGGWSQQEYRKSDINIRETILENLKKLNT